MSRREFEHALVIGKFMPPHEGHLYLIRTALLHCRRVTVLVLATSTERMDVHLRAEWLRECFAGDQSLRVVTATDDVPVDFGDAELWREHVSVMRDALERDDAARGASAAPIDVVFSAETYGAELARQFGARHVLLDPARVLHPVSGSLVRADLPVHWTQLPPPVRAGLAFRVVVIGAESTGTTTLAVALRDALKARGGVWERTDWVAEYGREYSVNLLAVARATNPGAAPTDVQWTEADFVHIAEVQTAREQEAARHGSPVLVCDTDALATCVWHERYRGSSSAPLVQVASTMPPRALYLLTDVHAVPFEDDGLRDGEHLRSWMTERFVEVLTASGVPWHLVTGSPSERLAAALRHVDDALPAWWARLGVAP